jgi:hypothetical protein
MRAEIGALKAYFETDLTFPSTFYSTGAQLATLDTAEPSSPGQSCNMYPE